MRLCQVNSRAILHAQRSIEAAVNEVVVHFGALGTMQL
jgi:hypothetical protein